MRFNLFSLIPFVLFATLCFTPIFPGEPVYAQTGEWVEVPLSAGMSGQWFWGTGESVAMVTRQNSRYLYFFDINSAQWTTVDLGNSATFSKFMVKGNVAMLFGDSLLIGYSGTASQWDSVHYQGQALDPNPMFGSPSWGCGENLCYFVTDQFVYVFDGLLGQWKSYPFNLPFVYTSGYGQFWARGDYFGMVIDNLSGVGPIAYNLAYSAHHHNFAELADGGRYSDNDWEFEHGFVANTIYSGSPPYKFIGYSAYTNQFDMVTLNTSPSLFPSIPNFIAGQIVENTTFVFSDIESVSPTTNRLHSYGFDTRNGSWVYHSWDYDPANWGVEPWSIGGQYGRAGLIASNHSKDFLVFSGSANAFSILSPGLHDLGGLFPAEGGSAFAWYDSTYIWFYSTKTGDSHVIPYTSEEPRGGWICEDYGIVKANLANDPNHVHFYIFNEAQNSVCDTIVPKYAADFSSSPYATVVKLKDVDDEMFFYSGIVNQFVRYPIPGSNIISINVNGPLSLVKVSGNSNFSVIYDATMNSLNTTNYKEYSVLGKFIAMVSQYPNLLYTYSALTHQGQETTLPENIGQLKGGDYVGILQTTNPEKFYAYNGFYGTLVPLQTGGSLSFLAGGKTALVVENSKAYAFNPQGSVTNLHPEEVCQPEELVLYQNYPNPFNPETTIEFKVPFYTLVQLEIFDLLGRKVNTLLNERMSPGRYRIRWDGRNNFGKPVASGMYIYRLQAGKKIILRKMLYMR